MIVFVSDVHLKPDDAGQRKPFLDFLEEQRARARELYLLGDIFDFWIGPRHLRAPDFRDALEGIRACVRAGVRVSFVPGNRDYFVEERFEAATGVRLAGDSVSLQLGGRRVLAAHGDFVYNRNPKYAAYRRLMRFRALREFYLAVPEFVSRGIARGFRKVSVRTTPAVRWTREALLADARREFRRGVDVLVVGHIHAPQHVRSEYEGRARDVFVLGDWEGGTRDYLEFDGREFRLRGWGNG